LIRIVKTPLKTSTSLKNPPQVDRLTKCADLANLDGLDGLSFKPSTFNAINSGALDGLDGLLSFLIIERSVRGGMGSSADPLGRCRDDVEWERGMKLRQLVTYW
jgi:hypothetical protein